MIQIDKNSIIPFNITHLETEFVLIQTNFISWEKTLLKLNFNSITYKKLLIQINNYTDCIQIQYNRTFCVLMLLNSLHKEFNFNPIDMWYMIDSSR